MCKKLICLVCFGLVLELVLIGATDAAGADLVGWWKFDEGSGTTARDSSRFGNHGTIINAEWDTGQFGKALYFNGTPTSAYVDIPPEAWSPIQEQVTVAFWLYGDPDKLPEARSYAFAAHHNSTWGRVMTVILPWANGYVYYDTGGPASAEGAGDIDRISKAMTPEEYAGSWQHWAFTKDVAAGEQRIYLNGVLWQSGSGKTKSIKGPIAAFTIGRGVAPGNRYAGLIDDFRLYDYALSEQEIQDAMAGRGIQHSLATEAIPADEDTDIPRDVILSWTPGEFANTHDVYFGTDFNKVNDADRTNRLGVLVSQNQVPTSYSPAEVLQFGQTYYWRIDEVNAPPDYTIYKGDVWQFTAEAFVYPIAGENITATASSSNSADEDLNNTINGSGLDGDDLHSAEAMAMWLSSAVDPNVAWIQYEFDEVYKLHEMWVWNHNTLVEAAIGFGVKDATIEYSLDGADWITVGTYEFGRGPGVPNYAYNTTVDLSGVVAKYVKITANSNWSGGIVDQYGLSEVRFFYIPVYAREPDPDSGATDVSIGTLEEPIDVILGFRAGREAVHHDVYLSTDEQAVIDGTAPITTMTETSYGPLFLDLGETYYWRVDEVNEAETPAMWPGDIWDFTTQEYFVVDDFEDYNDFEPDRIFDTWTDGYEDPTNGSQVGYVEPPFAEQSIVHGGKQSMPCFYDDNLKYSEAIMTLSSQRDWTIRGIGSLSLWFRGYPASVGSFTEAPAGTYTMTASGKDIWGTSDEFHFAYKQLTGPGSIIAKVESVEQTHNGAKAGVMIRDMVEADSAHAMMVVTPAEGVNFERRTTASESTSQTTNAGIKAPQWVKIELDIGGAVRASYSADGIEWTQLDREPIPMDTPMYIGLALTAHNANATCEAVFSNVEITGTAGQWMNQDIGILSNDPEPMYVALANSGGTPAVVYHPHPNATQMGTWTEWSINLDQFVGVNLTNVDMLCIGFGDKANPQAGSLGTMYFDDIRLYPLREPEADLTGN